MVVSRMTKMFCLLSLMASFNVYSSIDNHAMTAVSSVQMVNLNLSYKTKNKIVKSNLIMPFYQTAELEKKIGDKNLLIEINPKRGKSANEVALDMKFYNASGSAIYKKEVIAKLNEDAHIKFRGVALKVRPVLN